jgi:NADPH-dependent glutamate synthase beta subunit-like oxidoreductase
MSELENIIQKCIGDEFPPCEAACPLHVNAKGYVALISQGRFEDALRLIMEKLPFPGIMARVCTHPCEAKCKRAEVDEAIAIAALKRCAADYAQGVEWDLSIDQERAERIAIIGAGPAGLMAAYELRKLGYQVTIFEALPFPGGMLRVGIPEYRLPRPILEKEIGIVQKLGVEIKLNTPIGDEVTLADLRREFSAIFIAIGAHISAKLGIPGEDLSGVYPGLDFLSKVNSGTPVTVGDKVAVVGGGDVAIDSARIAYRLGAQRVFIVYRRSWAEMPASDDEIEAAESEGIEIVYLADPIRILAQDGKVKGMECIRMELGELDERGRRRPIPITGSEFFLAADIVIPAIGQSPNISFMDKNTMLQLKPGGTFDVDPITLETNIAGIFAGGDAVSGPATVIDALAAGRKAAISIDRYLNGQDLTIGREEEGAQESRLIVNIEGVAKKERIAMPALAVEQRRGNFQEVELGLSKEEAKKEAERCLSCECKLCIQECEFLKQLCQSPKELAHRFELGYFREKPDIPYSCNLCDLCQKVCPEELNIGNMCLELRRQLAAEGLGPLPTHRFVKVNQDWSLSDNFALAQPDPESGECKRVFFPGCNLSGYSPSLVIKTYDYLRERLPGTGILLGCCGEPTHSLGEQAKSEQILNGVEAEMAKLGTSEIIVACPLCYRRIKQHAPQLKLSFLYEVMVGLGLPQGIKHKGWTFSLHDSCSMRWEKGIQDSVRALAQMMGYQIEEMEHSREMTRCCGMGGMVAFANLQLSYNVTKRRIGEAHFDILTYCAACREAFASEKPAIHILDLAFNPDWEQDRLKAPKTGKARRETQALLKSQLINRTKI